MTKRFHDEYNEEEATQIFEKVTELLSDEDGDWSDLYYQSTKTAATLPNRTDEQKKKNKAAKRKKKKQQKKKEEKNSIQGGVNVPGVLPRTHIECRNCGNIIERKTCIEHYAECCGLAPVKKCSKKEPTSTTPKTVTRASNETESTNEPKDQSRYDRKSCFVISSYEPVVTRCAKKSVGRKETIIVRIHTQEFKYCSLAHFSDNNVLSTAVSELAQLVTTEE
jgi:hypothetical protein